MPARSDPLASVDGNGPFRGSLREQGTRREWGLRALGCWCLTPLWSLVRMNFIPGKPQSHTVWSAASPGVGQEVRGGHQPRRAPKDVGGRRPAHGRPPSHAQAWSDLAVRLAPHTPACPSSLSASVLGWLGMAPVGTWALSSPQLALQA